MGCFLINNRFRAEICKAGESSLLPKFFAEEFVQRNIQRLEHLDQTGDLHIFSVFVTEACKGQRKTCAEVPDILLPTVPVAPSMTIFFFMVELFNCCCQLICKVVGIDDLKLVSNHCSSFYFQVVPFSNWPLSRSFFMMANASFNMACTALIKTNFTKSPAKKIVGTAR